MLHRRQFFTGSSALLMAGVSISVLEVRANPIVWVFRFFASGLVRRGAGRAIGRAAASRAARRGAVGSAGVGASYSSSVNAATRSLSRVRMPGNKFKNANIKKFSVRKELLREATITTGLSFVLPEDLGFNTDGIIGISAARAAEIQENKAIAIWITDEVNSITIEADNFSDQKVADFLVVGLKDLDSGKMLHGRKPIPLVVSPNKSFEIRDLKYKVPRPGPIQIEAFLINDQTSMTFEQKSRNIVVVTPDEIIRAG